MSFVDVRERCRDSPLRARSLLTVRAAISSARSSDLPWSSWLSLMCSYWRARFGPFLTPAGGMALLSLAADCVGAALPRRRVVEAPAAHDVDVLLVQIGPLGRQQ